MQSYNSVAWAIASAVAIGGVTATTAMAQEEPMLVGPLWMLEEIVYNNDTMTVPDDPELYSIQFFEDGTLGVRADCNVGNGVFDTESPDFITLQAFTLAACGPDSLDDEFRRGLSDAVNYFFVDGDLLMDLPFDTGTMRFMTDDMMVEEDMEEDVVVEEEMEEEDVVVEEDMEADMTEPVPGLW
ncbi:META domain-containing protein [Leptolyngbya iicbica]|uniref:META domain-containing protein n=2 Tax=Cyanophyceae TaxID=3028117 RepID=A0A4V2E283_9CYAN|nr:META domain-containing protein [Leptolyngbya sp. LK]RZM77352.1 META domain-containing protein [Leptolyngbya sp. LK]